MASSLNNSVDFSKKCFCIVTGASRGIGRTLAVELSEIIGDESVLILVARSQEGLEETLQLCKVSQTNICIKVMDLCNATLEQMDDILIESLKGRDPKEFDLDIIFHNVGSIGNVKVKTSDMTNLKEWREYYNLNVFNVAAFNSQFLKLFKGLEEKVVVVNITSLCAIKPMIGLPYYCSGKAAREMYFKVLAEEVPQLRVLNYSPGPVETEMIEDVIGGCVNDTLRDVFQMFKSKKTLLKPEVTVNKCISILLEGNYKSGDHVDFFD